MGDVTDIEKARTRTKPQKNAGATTLTTAEQFTSDDEVVALTALRNKLGEMLARADIHERDAKSVSMEYRAVRIELKEAKDRAAASGLGRRLTAVGDRAFDGDI